MNYSNKCFFLLLFACSGLIQAQEIYLPVQPEEGPGGSEYVADTFMTIDSYDKMDGYMLYIPEMEIRDNTPLVMFIHGYGAMNPKLYGAWIKHIVRKGNIVIFPRYQKTVIKPFPKKYSRNISRAYEHASKFLEKHGIPSQERPFYILGHSYGGALTAYCGLHYQKLGLPKPKALMPCQPGTGPYKGAKVKDYSEMDNDISLLTVVGDRDKTVKDKMGSWIYNSTRHMDNSRLFIHYPYKNVDSIRIYASHYEPLCLDETMDNGTNNLFIRKGSKLSRINPVDYLVYWRLFDALQECTMESKYCDYASIALQGNNTFEVASERLVYFLEIYEGDDSLPGKKMRRKDYKIQLASMYETKASKSQESSR